VDVHGAQGGLYLFRDGVHGAGGLTHPPGLALLAQVLKTLLTPDGTVHQRDKVGYSPTPPIPWFHLCVTLSV
jgi:hypothetical protein